MAATLKEILTTPGNHDRLMRYSIRILLIFAGLWSARPIPAQKALTTPNDSKAPLAYTLNEAYEVYSSILNPQSESVQQVVVVLETQPYKMCVPPGDEPDTSIREAIINYVEDAR